MRPGVVPQEKQRIGCYLLGQSARVGAGQIRTLHKEGGGRSVAARIDTVTQLGVRVQDLSLAGASLQDVFIGLTGRELRE